MNITVLSGVQPLLIIVDGSIIVRDEEKLEKMRFRNTEMRSLVKMLSEQPPAPRIVRDMYLEHINGVDVSTCRLLLERFHSSVA